MIIDEPVKINEKNVYLQQLMNLVTIFFTCIFYFTYRAVLHGSGIFPITTHRLLQIL
jgi:hypothetical protein